MPFVDVEEDLTTSGKGGSVDDTPTSDRDIDKVVEEEETVTAEEQHDGIEAVEEEADPSISEALV